LVLGAAGFVGGAVGAHLTAAGRSVMGIDRATPPFGNLPERLHTIDVDDIHSLRALLREMQPSILLNAIGHSPTVANSELTDFYARNTTNVLEAVQAERPSCRVVLLGSAAEYGNSTRASETDAQHPLSDYGRAKCGQFEVAGRFAANGLDVITARLFNPIGPGQRRHLFVEALLERIRRGERSPLVHSGNHVRDWIDVRDAARGLVTVAESPKPPTVANICTGDGQTVEFVAGIIAQVTGVETRVKSEVTSPDVLWHSVGNPQRILNLGWRPQYSLSESVAAQWRQHL
jgi:GDP-4-dehydro-6-deoxy-D-mannose reductase